MSNFSLKLNSLSSVFLTGLATKGETSEEIAGGVYILREKAKKDNPPDNIIDT